MSLSDISRRFHLHADTSTTLYTLCLQGIPVIALCLYSLSWYVTEEQSEKCSFISLVPVPTRYFEPRVSHGTLLTQIIKTSKFILIYLSIYLSVCLSVCLSVYLFIYLFMYHWLYSPLLDIGRFSVS
jgi:ABC-type phosphate transport system permease subunit